MAGSEKGPTEGGDGVRLLALLHPSREGFIDLRLIRGGGRGPHTEFIPACEPERAVERALELRDQGDVYFGVAPHAREDRTKAGVDAVPALWADFDDGNAVAALGAFPLKPSALVSSGRGHHAYFALKEPVELRQAESLLRRLVAALHADPQATSADRLLRLPGTRNHKTDPPAEVQLLELDAGLKYSADELERHLPPDPAPVVHEARPTESGGPSAPVQRLLDQLEDVRATGAGWSALCPAHEDTRPSLTISEGDEGRALVHCFAGCQPEDVVSALGLEMSDLFPDGPHSDRSGSLAAQLVDLALHAGAELFHDERGRAYAQLPVGEHTEVWKLGSHSFKNWLRRELRRDQRRVAGAQAINDAIEALSAEAEFDAPEREVFVRVAGDPARTLIDLGDSEWRVVEITPEGWRTLPLAPVPFKRNGATAALAEPATGGSIVELRPFVNVRDDSDFLLLLAFMVMAFMPRGPYPILALFGESGAAKSTTARVVRLLIDPVKAGLRGGSPNERDLMIAATGSWLVGFDNMRVITDRLSDALCQLSTGAGLGTRQLYSDDEEFVFEAMRPVLLNGIGQLARRTDLISRTVALELPVLREDATVAEGQFWENFEQARPQIQGALLELVSSVLRELPEVELDEAPRMADFARVGTALERAMGLADGSFLDALAGQRINALESSLDADPVAGVLLDFMAKKPEWDGTATELLKKLTEFATDELTRRRRWPSDAGALSKRLNDLAPALRGAGLEMERGSAGRGREKSRFLSIFWVGDGGDGGDA
jgi:hypothetical protein